MADDALTRKEAEMGSLTRGRILEVKAGVEAGRAEFNGTEFAALCDLALRALSLESVREEALETKGVSFDWEMDAVVESHLAELSGFKHPPYPDYQRLVETTARQYEELRQLAKKFGSERDAIRALQHAPARVAEGGAMPKEKS